MKNLLILFALISVYNVKGQNYNAALIPDSLKENADAVKRGEELTVIIKSVGKAIVKRKYAITILNEKGSRFAEYSNDYDNLKSLSDISGHLYDASGKELKSVKKKDIADVNVEDGFSLMLDDRIKKHNFFYNQYPYTVEYEDEEEFNGIYFLPFWMPFEGDEYAVQQSRYIVQTPADYNLRYKTFNYTEAPLKTSNDNGNIYTWEIKNVKAFSWEHFQPPLQEVTPSVYIGPSQFSIGGYTGNMTSWLDFGKFQLSLNEGRDQLPDNIKADIHTLTDGINDKNEKIKLLYEYMQNNTRYIGIQLGIGGWQPFDAKYVAGNKYGDCKALSNYMVSILKEAGIKANYVIVKSGSNENWLDESFPAPFYFNHVICCVPNGKDTTWLECTSQTKSAGYMGSFTGNRKALLIADDGGHIVNTPFYTSNDNTQVRIINASVDEAGNLSATVDTKYSGIEQEDVDGMLNYRTKSEQAEILKKEFDLPTYDIIDFNYKKTKAKIPVIEEQLKIVADNYATVSGKRLFIKPNILSESPIKLSTTDKRLFDIVYPYSFKNTDSIYIQIPHGFTIESMPKDADIKNEFGNYTVHFKTEDNKIFLYRSYEKNAGRFAPSEYNSLINFYDEIYKADRSKIVFVKKETN